MLGWVDVDKTGYPTVQPFWQGPGLSLISLFISVGRRERERGVHFYFYQSVLTLSYESKLVNATLKMEFNFRFVYMLFMIVAFLRLI